MHLAGRHIEAMRELHRPPLQPAHELVVVIAGDAPAEATPDDRHHDTQHVRCRRATVHQIADENGVPSGRCLNLGAPVRPCAVEAHPIAERSQKLDQLVDTAVDIADDVETRTLRSQVEKSSFEGNGHEG